MNTQEMLTKPFPNQKHQNVCTQICYKLMEEWPNYNRLPPIKQLAQELQASQLNTHRAIKDLVRKGILISRPKLGTLINDDGGDFRKKLKNYITIDLADQPIESPKEKWIQIIQENAKCLSGTLFRLKAINAFIEAMAGFRLRITQETIETRTDLLMEYNKPDALVAVNPSIGLPLACQPHQILTIISSTPYCTIKTNERFDLVTVDEVQGARMAGEYIKRLGWDDVCFVGKYDENNHEEFDETSKVRLKSFEEGLGKSIRPENQLICWSYSQLCGAEAVSRWFNLPSRPPVIFAGSDDLAFGFINGAMALRLKAGRDYQIIGFDGQQMEADGSSNTLTTVAVPMVEMGNLAARLLMTRLKNPTALTQRILLGCTLIEGSTTIPRSSV